MNLHLRRNYKLLLLVIGAIVASLCFYIYFHVDLRSQIFRSFAKGNWFITSQGDTLYTSGFYGIRMYDISSPDNPILVKENAELCKFRNVGRGIAINGDYIYLTTRFYMGFKDEVDHPDYKIQFEDSISYSSESLGEFSNLLVLQNAGADNYGAPDMNIGVRSLRLYASQNQGKIILQKKIAHNEAAGFFSFWFRIDNPINNCFRIPLVGKDDKVLYSLNLSDSEEKGVIIQNSSAKMFECGEWYQLKVSISKKQIVTWWRTKECGRWELLSKEEGLETEYNSLLIGLYDAAKNDTLLVDDFYYSKKDFDQVSYINGSLKVLNRHDLTVFNSYASDTKLVEAKIYKDYLYTSCLYGFNIYSLTNPQSPKLEYTYRHPSWREFQGFDFFEADNKDYVVFSMFAEGIQIWDITDQLHPFIVCTIPLQTACADGKKLPKGTQTFDIITNYPYAYAAIGPMISIFGKNTDNRGVMVYNLSCLDSIIQNYIEIPKELWYQGKSSDRAPTAIEIYHNKLYTNFAEKGMAIFDLSNPAIPQFESVEPIGNNGLIQPIHIAKGHIYAGSYYWRTIYNTTIE